VIRGQPLTVRLTSGEGRTLAQPDNRIRQIGISPAAKLVIFTFEFLNGALPVTQQRAVLLGGGIKLRLRPAAGLCQYVEGNQLAVFLRQLFALRGNVFLLRVNKVLSR